MGEIVGWQENALRGIGFQSYLAVHSDPAAGVRGGLIGVLTVQGGIVEFGPTGVDVANAEVLVDQIRMAKEDEQIKARDEGGLTRGQRLPLSSSRELSAFEPLVSPWWRPLVRSGIWRCGYLLMQTPYTPNRPLYRIDRYFWPGAELFA